MRLIVFFKKNISKLVRASLNAILDFYNPNGIKSVTRLRLCLNKHLDHKFKHKFQDVLNSTCYCRNTSNISIHHLLHCSNYVNGNRTLLRNLQNISKRSWWQWLPNIKSICLCLAFHHLIYKTASILTTTIQHIVNTKMFGVPLNDSWYVWNVTVFKIYL